MSNLRKTVPLSVAIGLATLGAAQCAENSADAISWLLQPIDSHRQHQVDMRVSWHARLMVAAWAILFPVGILAARFFKITPRQDWPSRVDNPTWWHLHRCFQYAGGAAVLIAWFLIWQVASRPAEMHLHRILGYATVGLCAVQFISAWLRGSKGGPTDPAPDGSWSGDHYDMTLRRLLFEHCHKKLGYLAFGLSVGATLSGLWMANGPRWMWLGLSIWWGLLVLLFAELQRRSMAVDTYQALWGPDTRHPGNRRKPIGWGIARR